MGRRRVIFVLPKLNDCKGDITKVWYVEYSYRDERTNKLERFRIYEGFKQIESAKKRREHTKKI